MIYNLWCNPNIASKYIKENLPDHINMCTSLADEICMNQFTFRGHWEMERTNIPVSFNKNIVWDKTPNGDNEWIYAFNRLQFIVVLGEAWNFTNDHKYLDHAAYLIDDWIKQNPLTEDSQSTTWRPIEAGIRCENLLRALQLFDGHLSNPIVKSIEELLVTHGEFLLNSHTAFQLQSNWGILQNHGLFLAGLAFENYNWCKIAMDRLEQCLHLQIMDDGTHWEQSPLYHCEVLHCCLDTILTAKRTNFPIKHEIILYTKKISLALGKMLRPDGKLFCQSDSDEVDARDLMALSSFIFNDPILKGYANANIYPENCWDFADYFKTYNNMSIKNSYTSVALTDSGNYMIWDGTGENAGMMHFHCGSLGGGHGHADLLHMDLVYNSESILIDSGRYTYVEGDIRKKLKSPNAHNTITINSTDFTKYESTWGYSLIAQPIKGEYKFTPSMDYVCGSHLGYLSCGIFTRRRILRLGHGLWVIFDDFQCSDLIQSYLYERTYHFSSKGKLEQQFDGVFSFETKNTYTEIVFPDNDSIFNITKEPSSREYNKLEYGDCLHVNNSRVGSTHMATVIGVSTNDSAPNISCTYDKLYHASSKKPIPTSDGAALNIACGNSEWTVFLLNSEIFDTVSPIESNGHIGYGKVVVFEPDLDEGITLAW